MSSKHSASNIVVLSLLETTAVLFLQDCKVFDKHLHSHRSSELLHCPQFPEPSLYPSPVCSQAVGEDRYGYAHRHHALWRGCCVNCRGMGMTKHGSSLLLSRYGFVLGRELWLHFLPSLLEVEDVNRFGIAEGSGFCWAEVGGVEVGLRRPSPIPSFLCPSIQVQFQVTSFWWLKAGIRSRGNLCTVPCHLYPGIAMYWEVGKRGLQRGFQDSCCWRDIIGPQHVFFNDFLGIWQTMWTFSWVPALVDSGVEF